MQFENNDKIEIHQHNYSGAEAPTYAAKSKRYRWIIVSCAVPLLVAYISNWEKFSFGKAAVKGDACGYLKEQLQHKQTELNDIERRLLLPGGKNNLRLSSDSLAHAIDIVRISSQLKQESCSE